jgi:hypothetical protein
MHPSLLKMVPPGQRRPRLDTDSVHTSSWVSPRDLGVPLDEQIKMIASCDINAHWSASILLVRGQLRGFFCEVAGAMASLNESNPDWAGSGEPMGDVGVPIHKDWWKLPMEGFAAQVETCCMHCAIPLRRQGQPALGDGPEQFSEVHRFIARPKVKSREVAFVGVESLTQRSDRPATNYLPGTTPGYREPTA